jgi:hypothetical protein
MSPFTYTEPHPLALGMAYAAAAVRDDYSVRRVHEIFDGDGVRLVITEAQCPCPAWLALDPLVCVNVREAGHGITLTVEPRAAMVDRAIGADMAAAGYQPGAVRFDRYDITLPATWPILVRS